MKLRLSELHYNLGHVLHQQGNLAGSVAAYQEAIRLDRSFAQAHHSLAVVLADQGGTDAAIFHYRRAIALKPQAVKAYNNLGCLLIAQNRSAEAIPLYQQAIAIDPNQATLHSNLGKAIEAQDRVAAIAAYRRAIQLQPDFVAAHYNLGQLLLLQKQYQAALACFQKVLQLEPDHTKAQTACGVACLAMRSFDQAWSYFREALQFSLPCLEAFCRWVDGLSGNDELTQARQACSQFARSLLDADPTDPAAHLRTCHYLAQAYHHLGNLLLHYGGMAQLQLAETYYQQAIVLKPEAIELYLQLGICLEQQQRWNAASVFYHAALARYPHTAPFHHRLGRLLEQQQRWSEAISHYRQAMQLVRQQGAAPPIPSKSVLPKPEGLNSVSTAAFTPTSPIQGIYRHTLDWITQHSQGHFIALQPDVDHQLQPISAVTTPVATPVTPAVSAMLPLPDANQPTDCDGLNCHPCLEKLTQQFSPLHLGSQVHQLPHKRTALSPPTFFVAHLPQAQAWMTPYQAAWMVTNSLTILSADRYLLADVSREYPGQLPICTRTHASFQRFLQNSHRSPEVIKGRVAALAGLSGHNYFHWMVDVLPRFELLRRSGLRWSDLDCFWVHQGQAAFQQEMLDYLEIPSHQVLAADRHPVIQAETLIVPSFPGHLGWLEPWALAFLRQQFLPIATSHAHRKHQSERIYISRANAHHRRLLNEAEVVARLQSLDFKVVELETLSVAEQIALFAQAKAIVAPHGGGLTNLIFCKPGTTVIELMTPSYIRHYYWQISQQLGLNHYFAIGSEFSCAFIHRLMYPSPLMEDIWLDAKTLDVALTQAGLA